MPDNPFIPSFGVSPLYLAGRQAAIDSIRRTSLDRDQAVASRACLIVGQRGIGKTVLLNHIEDLAKQADWLIVRATASAGFVERMVNEQLRPLVDQVDPPRAHKTSARLGVNLPPVIAEVGIDPASTQPATTTLRTCLYQIAQAVPQRGLLFTIDEVNSRARRDLEEFATVYQHAIRDGLNVAVVLAALPAVVDPLLTRHNGPLTFLNRANRVDLSIFDFVTAQEAFGQTIAQRGTRRVGPETVEMMAAASKGYPFLVQTIGHLAWEVDPNANEITADDVRSVLPQAHQTMATAVLAPIMRSLPNRLRQTLVLIAQQPSLNNAALAAQLGIQPTSLGGLLQRLAGAGVIARTGRGEVRITVPYLQEYAAQVDQTTAPTNAALAALDSFPELGG